MVIVFFFFVMGCCSRTGSEHGSPPCKQVRGCRGCASLSINSFILLHPSCDWTVCTCMAERESSYNIGYSGRLVTVKPQSLQKMYVPLPTHSVFGNVARVILNFHLLKSEHISRVIPNPPKYLKLCWHS